MSSFYRRTKNPETGQFEEALWCDDHFGRHHYGVQFAGGRVYRQSDHEWEFDDTPLQPSWPPAEIVEHIEGIVAETTRRMEALSEPAGKPQMVPSAKERVDAVYEAWNDPDAEGPDDIEALHERAMQQAYDDGCAVCREKLAAMMLRLSIPTGHGDTFDDLLRELAPGLGAGMSGHPQIVFIRRALRDLESLRDAAVCNGPNEQKLAAYLRAACKCVELAVMEAQTSEPCHG